MKEKDKFISYIKNKLWNTHRGIHSNEYFIKGMEAMQRIKTENKGDIKKKEGDQRKSSRNGRQARKKCIRPKASNTTKWILKIINQEKLPPKNLIYKIKEPTEYQGKLPPKYQLQDISHWNYSIPTSKSPQGLKDQII